MKKVYQISTEICGSIICTTVQGLLAEVKDNLDSEEIKKIEIEIIEISEEEFNKLPEFNGC